MFCADTFAHADMSTINLGITSGQQPRPQAGTLQPRIWHPVHWKGQVTGKYGSRGSYTRI
jgi:hypothetical protein